MTIAKANKTIDNLKWIRTYNFEVEGQPVGKQRPRTISKKGKTWTYTPTKTEQAEKAIGLIAKQYIKKPIENPVSMSVIFASKGHRRGDLDNLIKLVLDGLNGVAFVDDRQVIHLSADIVFVGQNPKTYIEIREVNLTQEEINND